MIRRIIGTILMTVATGVLVNGCASSSPSSAVPEGATPFPEERSLGAQFPSISQQEEFIPTAKIEPVGSLGLEQALALALLHNPDLASFAFEVRAAEARTLQAGKIPNPTLGMEMEEYNRAGSGFDSTELALAISQLIELGGKRHYRMEMAAAESRMAGWDYESRRLDVVATCAQRFVAVVAAQRRLDLARSTVEVAEETHRAVSKRVSSGKEPPLQASKSLAELEMTRIDLQVSHNDLAATRRELAAMWGSERPEFEVAEGKLEQTLETVPSYEELKTHLAQNPDLARWEVTQALGQARLAAAKAVRIPDLEASFGIRRYEEDGTNSMAFGLGLPLPLFDRNQGNIAAAHNEMARNQAQQKALQLALVADLAEAHANLLSAGDRVLALQTKVLPAMEEAFNSAQTGYQQGKFRFLDMLDAQRGLFEARGSLVDAFYQYHLALAEIQRITGTSLEKIKSLPEEKSS